MCSIRNKREPQLLATPTDNGRSPRDHCSSSVGGCSQYLGKGRRHVSSFSLPRTSRGIWCPRRAEEGATSCKYLVPSIKPVEKQTPNNAPLYRSNNVIALKEICVADSERFARYVCVSDVIGNDSMCFMVDCGLCFV
jgi:hypothetical protein